MTVPASPPHPSAGVTGPPNMFGRISVILVAITLVIAAISTVARTAILVGDSGAFGLYSLLSTGSLVVEGALSIAALVVGIMGLQKRDRPRVLAGIGTGAAGAVIAGILIGLLGTATSIAMQQPITL